MSKFYVTKTLTGLLPSNRTSEDAMQKLKTGEEYMVEVKRPRNLKHHKKFFALIGLVFDNQSRYQSTDELLDMIKIAAGHVDVRVSPSGQEYKIPKSINFASMDQAAFDVFYQSVVDVVCKYFIPGLDQGELKRELMEFSK